MIDTKAVNKYAKKFSDVNLSEKECLEIIANFSKLKWLYVDSVKKNK